MEEFIARLHQYLDTYRLPEDLDTLCRRGFCGQINVNLMLCDVLKTYFNLTPYMANEITMYVTTPPLESIYLKKCCICDNVCSKVNGCIRTNGKECDGHYILIISKYNNDIINEAEDYVLDLTYKQMLIGVPYETESIPFIESIPSYVLLPYLHFLKYPEYHTGITPQMAERWDRNITQPCKFITNADCRVPGGRRVNKTRYSVKNKVHKKNKKRSKRRVNRHKQSYRKLI